MIKTFISKLLGKSADGAKRVPRGKRVEVPKSEHGIDPKLVDERAVKVVSTLADAGYEAYVVGGAVRDLLVGLRPKDFDVATNATPEQVKSLFRRAFIIGRRFRIVHVVFGRGRQDRGLSEVIEVSTFRAMLAAADAEQVSGNEKTSRKDLVDKTHVVDAEGRVLRDNVWGPQVEDAARRDFTVNAMYYDPVQGDRRRLPRRHQGCEEEAAADDRRPGLALPRGPGADHPRRPLRRQARLRDRGQDARADQGDGDAARQRAAVAHLRRDDQAAADRPCAGVDRRAEEARPAPRRVPGARRRARRGRSATTGARSSSAWRLPTPTPASPRASRWRRASCSRRCSGTTCRTNGSGARRPASRRSPRSRERSTPPSTRASATSPGAASWRSTCARSGCCSRASSGARAARRRACSSSRAFAPASISCACAARSARPIRPWPRGGKRCSRRATSSAATSSTACASSAVRAGSSALLAADRAARPTATPRWSSMPAATTRPRQPDSDAGEAPAADAGAPRKRRRRRRKPSDSAGPAS